MGLTEDARSSNSARFGGYPWSARLAWEVRGYMYYVDCCDRECLDVACGLWLAGADYISMWIQGSHYASWRHYPTAYKGEQKGGYSNP